MVGDVFYPRHLPLSWDGVRPGGPGSTAARPGGPGSDRNLGVWRIFIAKSPDDALMWEFGDERDARVGHEGRRRTREAARLSMGDGLATADTGAPLRPPSRRMARQP
jgi:hypothetical protein